MFPLERDFREWMGGVLFTYRWSDRTRPAKHSRLHNGHFLRGTTGKTVRDSCALLSGPCLLESNREQKLLGSQWGFSLCAITLNHERNLDSFLLFVLRGHSN